MTPRTFVTVCNLRPRRGQQCSHHAPRDARSSRGARRLHFRHGATVLEVIFSIAIVAVGLLGTLTIIPVAGNRLAQGQIADGADRTGRNAIREFDIGQMSRANSWAFFRTADHQYVPVSSTTVTQTSFCIDPLFVSTHVNNWDTASSLVLPQTECFPYSAGAATRMKRITLRKFPGATHNPPPLPPPPNGSSQMGMPLNQAYQIFMSQDDLVFDLPEDRTLLPEQKFDSNNAKRQFNGNYTWMATLSPWMPTLWPSRPARTDMYVLSIVVFYRRDMSMAVSYGPGPQEPPDSERVVDVAQFYGSGYAGGDVRLQTTSPTRPSKDLDVKQGEWLMLSALSGTTPVFRWFRVVSTDSGPLGSGPYTRDVTLQGPDWNPNWTSNQATLLNGVVAVYEKTIRLETSGIWTVP